MCYHCHRHHCQAFGNRNVIVEVETSLSSSPTFELSSNRSHHPVTVTLSKRSSRSRTHRLQHHCLHPSKPDSHLSTTRRPQQSGQLQDIPLHCDGSRGWQPRAGFSSLFEVSANLSSTRSTNIIYLIESRGWQP